MTNQKELFESFLCAKSEFKTPVKDKKANYGWYASLGSIHDATKSLAKYKLFIMQPLIVLNGQNCIKTIICHAPSGQSFESIISMPDIPSSEKNIFHKIGCATTYLRRYALQSMLGISADDIEDDGDALNGVSTATQNLDGNVTPEYINEIIAMIGGDQLLFNEVESRLKNKFNVESIYCTPKKLEKGIKQFIKEKKGGK